MTAADLFRRMMSALAQAEIPSMLTGSFASAYHGTARATQDINLVIEADAGRLRTLVALLPPNEYYVDLDAALEALRFGTQFNVMDLATGWRVDFIFRKDRPFSREEFERRQRAQFGGSSIAVVTAEDLVIAKLEWSKEGGSLRQLEDVAAILRSRGAELDVARVDRWVESLGLQAEWRAARRMLEG